MNFNSQQSLLSAQNSLEIESESIKRLAKSLPADFPTFIEKVLYCKGRVVVSGVGKSGHVGKKIAASLASTGTPSFFVHSTEASHGDLGMIQHEDMCLLISNSGEAKELNDILTYVNNLSIQMGAISSNLESTLMKAADYKLTIPKCVEACPLGMAPTTSSVVTLAFGDAIAVALMKQRNFTKADYNVFHPGGKLGKQMLLTKKIMHTGDKIPIVSQDDLMEDVLIEMTSKSFGIAAVCSDSNLIGVISDGDLRRNMNNLLKRTAKEIASKKPQTVTEDTFATDALKIMNQNQISVLIVIDHNNSPKGILHIHDLVRAGIV